MTSCGTKSCTMGKQKDPAVMSLQRIEVQYDGGKDVITFLKPFPGFLFAIPYLMQFGVDPNRNLLFVSRDPCQDHTSQGSG